MPRHYRSLIFPPEDGQSAKRGYTHRHARAHIRSDRLRPGGRPEDIAQFFMRAATAFPTVLSQSFVCPEEVAISGQRRGRREKKIKESCKCPAAAADYRLFIQEMVALSIIPPGFFAFLQAARGKGSQLLYELLGRFSVPRWRNWAGRGRGGGVVAFLAFTIFLGCRRQPAIKEKIETISLRAARRLARYCALLASRGLGFSVRLFEIFYL